MAAASLPWVEKSLLRGKWDAQISEATAPATDLAKLVVECRFRDALTSSQARTLFRPISRDLDLPFKDLLDLSTHPGSDSLEQELVRLSLSIACLHAFVQANWTGPDLDIHPLDLLTGDSDGTSSWTEESLHAKAITELAYGGEPAYHLVKDPAFLRLSQLLVGLTYNHIPSISWWRLRVAKVHQQILDEPVVKQEDFRALLEPLGSTLASEPDLAGRLHLELGLLEHHGALGKRTKFQVTELSQLVLLAESQLTDDDSAGEASNIIKQDESSRTPDARAGPATSVPETLALNDDTLLEQTEFTSSHPAGPGASLSHIDPSAQPPLHPLDQCILLSLCLNVRNTSPAHGLTAEQMAPYVARVIAHPRNWSVHTMALLLRARLESARTRTVERATLQLQALIEQMPTADAPPAERLRYVHALPLPSRWEMETELARRFLSLGVVRSALAIFERREMWEAVVRCYAALEKPERGVAIVRDLLEGRKAEAGTVVARGKAGTSACRRALEDSTRHAKLWCLLGDLEPANAQAHYEKAWVLSGETSGRAVRSLGGWFFAHGQYREAVECLEKAVRINPLLTRSWFILGCAFMRVEDWEGAKNAFGRCVAIDEEDGESWNNLASMYLRIGGRKTIAANGGDEEKDSESHLDDDGPAPGISFSNKLLAFHALKQGLRFSYDNWRMWYNYMIVAMDVGELQEACRALGRIVEQTGDKAGVRAVAVDEDVLDRLVDAVMRAPANASVGGEDAGAEAEATQNGSGSASVAAAHNPNEGHGLYRPVRQLFERTLLPRLSTPRIFRAYARLLSWRGEWGDALKAYLDAYRASTSSLTSLPSSPLTSSSSSPLTAPSPSLSARSDLESFRAAATEVHELVDVLRTLGPRVAGYKWRFQARSVVRAFVGRAKEEFGDEPEWAGVLGLLGELKGGERED